jgi:hypothetical protein
VLDRGGKFLSVETPGTTGGLVVGEPYAHEIVCNINLTFHWLEAVTTPNWFLCLYVNIDVVI